MQSFHPSAAPALLAALVLPAVAHAGTMSHVRTVMGRESGGEGPFGCATSGPQVDIRNWFGAAVGIPTEGYDVCHLKGSTENHSGPGATTAASIASGTFHDSTASASAQAHADYTRLGTSADLRTDGDPYWLGTVAAEGVGFVSDTLTFHSSLPYGFVQFGFTIDGSLHSEPRGSAYVELKYQLDNKGIYWALRGVVEPASSIPSQVRAFATPDFNGYTLGNNDLTVNGTVYTYDDQLVAMEKPIDFTYALFSAVYGGANGSVASSYFGSTVRLTSIALTDTRGKSVDFTVTSASGTLYDAKGAHAPLSAVPEPANWALLILGFGAAGTALRRRKAIPPQPARP